MLYDVYNINGFIINTDNVNRSVKPFYYDVTNCSTMTSLTILLCH